MHAADASGYFVLFYNIFPNYFYNEPDRAGNLLMRSIRKDPSKHREIIHLFIHRQLYLWFINTRRAVVKLLSPAALQPLCQSQRDLKGKVCEMYARMAGRIHFSHQLGKWAGFLCDSWEKEERSDKRWVGQLFPPRGWGKCPFRAILTRPGFVCIWTDVWLTQLIVISRE